MLEALQLHCIAIDYYHFVGNDFSYMDGAIDFKLSTCFKEYWTVTVWEELGFVDIDVGAKGIAEGHLAYSFSDTSLGEGESGFDLT